MCEIQLAPESGAIRGNFTYKRTWCHILWFVYCEMPRISLLIRINKKRRYSQGVSSNGLFSDCWLTEFGSVLVHLISSSHYFIWPKWSASNLAFSFCNTRPRVSLFQLAVPLFFFPEFFPSGAGGRLPRQRLLLRFLSSDLDVCKLRITLCFDGDLLIGIGSPGVAACQGLVSFLQQMLLFWSIIVSQRSHTRVQSPTRARHVFWSSLARCLSNSDVFH